MVPGPVPDEGGPQGHRRHARLRGQEVSSLSLSFILTLEDLLAHWWRLLVRRLLSRGVRYMSCGLKVYYCPLVPFHDEDAWPTLYAFFPLFRQILLRERITIVHTHQVRPPCSSTPHPTYRLPQLHGHC